MSDEEYIALLKTFKTDIPTAIIHYPEEMMKYVVSALGVPDEVLCWVYASSIPRQFRLINIYNAKPDFSQAPQPYKNPDDSRVAHLIRCGSPGAASYDWLNINFVKNVSKEKTLHPCQIPVALMEKLILMLSRPGDTIYDLFAGSGTTLVAARNLGRKAIGTEISRNYYKMAKQRLAEEAQEK